MGKVGSTSSPLKLAKGREGEGQPSLWNWQPKVVFLLVTCARHTWCKGVRDAQANKKVSTEYSQKLVTHPNRIPSCDCSLFSSASSRHEKKKKEQWQNSTQARQHCSSTASPRFFREKRAATALGSDCSSSRAWEDLGGFYSLRAISGTAVLLQSEVTSPIMVPNL